ncbi:hypothetical protein KJ765_03460 [Candidatus Micrarchaeota archaeon]|nr:hypothetical protein [Candidatus Micrarchaeota archaeon]
MGSSHIAWKPFTLGDYHLQALVADLGSASCTIQRTGDVQGSTPDIPVWMGLIMAVFALFAVRQRRSS